VDVNGSARPRRAAHQWIRSRGHFPAVDSQPMRAVHYFRQIMGEFHFMEVVACLLVAGLVHAALAMGKD